MIDKLLGLLAQPQTWRGLIYVLTAAGVALDPAIADKVVAAGMGLAGLLAIFWHKKDGKTE